MTLFKNQEIKEPNFDAIPQELKRHPKWMMWKAEPKKNKPDEMGKVPYQVNGYRASKNNPEHWLSFEEAKATFEKGGFDGIGIVFNRNDGLVCIDIDDLEDISKAPDFVNQSYTELSPSESGLHLWIRGIKPEWVGTKQNGIEIYGSDANSFLTITGNIFINKPVMANQSLIVSIAEKYFLNQKPQEEAKKPKKVIKFKQVPDDVVINKMFDSKQGEQIKALFSGDWTAFSSQSEADQSLCNHLAYWTNDDAEQMDRLFRHSRLFRNKWDEKRGNKTYGELTIEKAIKDKLSEFRTPTKVNLPEPDLVDFESTEVDRPDWWIENQNGTKSLRHSVLAEWIIETYRVFHFPDIHGDLYFYNPESGLYEQDKKGRCIRSFIRDEYEFKANQVKETLEYITDKAPVKTQLSKDYFAVNNGLLHLKTLEFKEFTPDEFLISKVPTNYNPEAFDSFVDDTLKRVTDGYEPSIRNIEEMFGCVLYPKMLVPKMFYLFGRSANNGKSSLLYMIHKAFNLNGGNISAVNPQKLASNTFAGSSMVGKMANIVDDLPDLVIEDSGALKTAITGGYIEVEKKGKDSETVEMNTTLITASNHFPNFREHGNQINRRLHIIPFDHDFSNDAECLSELETNKRLSSQSAREYVLKLSVDAVKRMLETTGSNKLTPNEKSNIAKLDFSEHNDPLTEYFEEYDREYFLKAKGMDAYQDYKWWCDRHYIHALGLKKYKDAIQLHYNLKYGSKQIKADTPSGLTTIRGFKEN